MHKAEEAEGQVEEPEEAPEASILRELEEAMQSRLKLGFTFRLHKSSSLRGSGPLTAPR